MLMAIGKGIELDVDVTRFNTEVHDHLLRTGLRNLLMDAHASATAKAHPENYIKRSREMAEKKLASLYEGVVRAQSFGGPKAPTDPVSAVVMRLARRAIQKGKGFGYRGCAEGSTVGSHQSVGCRICTVA